MGIYSRFKSERGNYMGKLTVKEINIIEKLADCYNSFIELEDQHPSDEEDFSRHIHVLQRHVMARSTRREHPDLFGKTNG